MPSNVEPYAGIFGEKAHAITADALDWFDAAQSSPL